MLLLDKQHIKLSSFHFRKTILVRILNLGVKGYTHPFFDILFGSLCAVIAGAMAGLISVKTWASKMVLDSGTKAGIPADDTIAQRHFCHDGSRPAFSNGWLLFTPLTQEMIAIDGKTLRGSPYNPRPDGTIHMIALATANKAC